MTWRSQRAQHFIAPATGAEIHDAEKHIHVGPRSNEVSRCPEIILSIGPILAVPGIRAALDRRRRPIVAVSPLVGGRAVTGPLVRLLRAAAVPSTSAGIARCYRSFLDALVIDRRDSADRNWYV